MINKLSITNNNINNNQSRNTSGANIAPKFKGGNKVVKLLQECEKQPIINVAVVDLVTAILPRTLLESATNVFAGFEAFRRESSGLIVNCLIPGFITLGFAKAMNNGIMGKGKADMSGCWASSDTISKVSDHYINAEKTEAFKDGMSLYGNKTHARVYAVNYNMLNEASGVDGYKNIKFKDAMSHSEISDNAQKLTKMSFKHQNNKMTEEVVEKIPKKRIKAIFRNITRKTHVAQDITFGLAGEKNSLVSNLERTLTDTHQVLKGIVKEKINPENVSNFVKRSKKLLKSKSILGILTILPLAASMQHINRIITEKTSGVKGAPIHDNYGKDSVKKTEEEIKAEKKSLVGRKVWAVSSMLGVAMLSMMKMPNLKTLKNIVQFKNQFPTMDQARAISAVTFASRMAVADDAEELKEAHTRDLVTFASMYFLGDYGAKAAATHYEKTTGIELSNKTFDPSKNKGFFTKAKNWVLHTHLKSTEELKGTGKALEYATKLRAKCQMANIGTSLILLGAIVPIYTRLKTKQSDAKKKALQEEKAKQIMSQQDNKTAFFGNFSTIKKESPIMKQFRSK